MICRNCRRPLEHSLIDLGFAPLSNSYLLQQELDVPEVTFPLKILICDSCWLVQTRDYITSDVVFTNGYAYFSSTSTSWLNRSKMFCEDITNLMDLDQHSFVVEIASNDGYLLQYFNEKGIPNLGIEPTQSTAQFAQARGVNTLIKFFDKELAIKLAKDKKPDLIVAANVLAHVPEIREFVEAVEILIDDNGIVVFEFPHLMNMVNECFFDTIYHEHFSYISIFALRNILLGTNLRMIKIEEVPTHGGSLRVFVSLVNSKWEPNESVDLLLQREIGVGLNQLSYYSKFEEHALKIKNDFLRFLLQANANGKSVAAYGAAAKGNTLINFAGVRSDLIEFVCDAAESKQGRFLPGSHIPIYSPEYLKTNYVDYLIILPWNLSEEIANALEQYKSNGTKIVSFFPNLKYH